MEYLEAEGQYNPAVEPSAGGEADCAREGWGGLTGEAQTAIWVTLGQLAMLASTVTADTTHYTQEAPGTVWLLPAA